MIAFKFFFLCVIGAVCVSAGGSAKIGAPAGDFDNWVFATYWEDQWIQSSCSDDFLVDHFNATSYGATHLSLHGMWPNYNYTTRGYDYPAYCEDGDDDYTKCQYSDAPDYCFPSSQTLSEFNVTNRWMAYATEYSWATLASHEWGKHGGCTGWTQEYFFNVDEQMYNWLKGGSGFAYVTSHVGQTVPYNDLYNAFSKDTDGKRLVFQCEDGCHFSEFWMGWQADQTTLLPTYPIDLSSGDTDTCLQNNCDNVIIADYSDTCARCQDGQRGPACVYSSSTSGTDQDPCLEFADCVRCASTSHDGVHYCTNQESF
uniref:Uncharacterized protein n=1 Tax=Paramoeba aestuarina TaxID=180227 RepID=A0A7S4PC36_9EUKA|mmetsp:Transcript_40156/g.63515  ORF Transcript_40156/g.63515 Transcript_40156/m.63515 type:complete len:313 (+) Transcript_40156:147-1085(+)